MYKRGREAGELIEPATALDYKSQRAFTMVPLDPFPWILLFVWFGPFE